MDKTALRIEPDPQGEDVMLNAGYYHRLFKTLGNGAMGRNIRHRGFSDQNLFMAMTNHAEVVPSRYRHCEGDGDEEVCVSVEQRWTYAIPLEVVYMTPLSSWNFYDIPYRGEASSEEGSAVTADGRYGGSYPETAYNGSNSDIFYQTPTQFFNSDERTDHPADTTRNEVGVLDSDGIVRSTRASGHRIILPSIPGVGQLRQRYQVMPIHGEGQTVMKELAALKDIVMNPEYYEWALTRNKKAFH